MTKLTIFIDNIKWDLFDDIYDKSQNTFDGVYDLNILENLNLEEMDNQIDKLCNRKTS